MKFPNNQTFRLMPVFFVLILTNFTQAQTRKYSNEFLAIGVGARALGMSGAQVSSVQGVNAGYWNPAGLTQIESNIQLGGMHAEYFAGIAKYDHLGFGAKIDSVSSIGFSFIRFGVDDIPNTIDLIDANGNINYDRITSFSAADHAFIFSYARKLKIPRLSLGANAKIIYRKVGSFAKAWGFGLDVGMKYKYKGFEFGLMARDVTTTYNAWSFSLDERTKEVFTLTGNEIPSNSYEITTPKFILGASRYLALPKKMGLLSEVNFDFSTDGRRNVLISGDPISIDPHLGIELSYDNIVFIRGGVGNIQKEKTDLTARDITTVQPNIGLGIKIKTLSIDYAFTDIGDVSAGLYSHVFSLKLDIHKRDKK